jgi:hypothetical protein
MTKRRTPLCWIALLALTAGLTLSIGARADDVGTDKTLAMDLFDRGVRKMRQGGCERSPVTDRAACEAARDALKRAYELYPEGLGALRNLAYVEAGLGLVASAARSFRELARRAPLDPNPARRLWAEFAHKEADALAARVPHLQIELTGEPPADMALLLDGSPVPEAAWRTPLDLDPGQHELRAQAPEHAPYVDSFALAEAEHKHISVALAPQRSEPLATLPSAAPAAPAPERSAPERTARSVTNRLAPLLLIGSGTAALAVGLGLGYKAMRERDDACGNTRACEPAGLATGKQAAHASTAITSLGVAAVASGLVWYFVRRKRERQATAQLAPALLPHGALLHAAGSF